MRRASTLPLFALSASAAWAQPSAEVSLVSAEVAADEQVALAGVRFEMPPGTHTYWVNPGEAGMAPRFEVLEPEGWSVDGGVWLQPPPEVFAPGGVVSQGYGGTVVLPVLLRRDAAQPAGALGEAVPLKLRVRYLVCDDDLCLPGEATLSGTLAPAASPAPPPPELAAALASLQPPAGFPASLNAEAGWTSRGFGFELRLPPEAENPGFFAFPNALADGLEEAARDGADLTGSDAVFRVSPLDADAGRWRFDAAGTFPGTGDAVVGVTAFDLDGQRRQVVTRVERP